MAMFVKLLGSEEVPSSVLIEQMASLTDQLRHLSTRIDGLLYGDTVDDQDRWVHPATDAVDKVADGLGDLTDLVKEYEKEFPGR